MDKIESKELNPDPNKKEIKKIELEGESQSSWYKYGHILFDRIAQKLRTFLNARIRDKTVSQVAGQTLDDIYDMVGAQIETKKLASTAEKANILKTLAETRKINAEAQQIEADTMEKKAKLAQSAQFILSELLEQEYIAITEEDGEVNIVILKDTPPDMMMKLNQVLSESDKSFGAIIDFKPQDQ